MENKTNKHNQSNRVAGDIEISSNESFTIDARKSGGINVDGNLKVNSQKDLTIIGDGESSENIDMNIKKILKDKDAFELYESNKKHKPTVIYTKEKYKAETSEFEMKKSTLVSEGEIIIDAANIDLRDSIIAAGEAIYFKGLEGVECDNTYIGSKKIYLDKHESATDLLVTGVIGGCKIEGALEIVANQFNHDEL